MNKKKTSRILGGVVCGVLCLSLLPWMGSCKKGKKDSIVIMTEELSGLFNPFYATAGTDMEVVGMTQISMLSTDSNGNPTAGDDEATVVKSFKTEQKQNETVYTFVLKNDLKFSDGKPLTMNDVIFNMYEYLDPVYTGSSTMYSIDIKGLAQYRLQQNLSSGSDEAESQLSQRATANAQMRIDELASVFTTVGKISGNNDSYEADEAKMKEAIQSWSVSDGYKDAVASEKDQASFDFNKQLLEDYEFTLKTFKEELESDYKAAKESYDLTTAPYEEWKDKLSNDVFKFFLYENYITPEYRKVEGREDKTKIEKFNGEEYVENYPTEDAAINRVYGDKVTYNLHEILTQWGTAGTLLTEYTAAAKDIILHDCVGDDGSLIFPNIEGIVSLGHTTTTESVEVDGVTYKVAHDHDENGVPRNADEYDVLQVTVNGTDPKAIYNFGFTVAPAHYYTADSEYPNGRPIDIANNQFGVEFASSNFQSKVIQSQEHVEVPVGAGAYAATNKNNDSNPSGSDFWNSNIVYFKANDNFMFDVKAKKLRMQVVSSTNALDKLKSGEVDYVEPQFTEENISTLKDMEKDGYKQLSGWQLGYGYIGINAGKVPNVNIRRAIMAAMEPRLAVEYYELGTATTLEWPMSKVSWAYPWQGEPFESASKNNNHDYTQWSNKDAAKEKIKDYMREAGVSEGSSDLKIKFTIAGASITEHPAYGVFKQAAEILNECGWDVEVKADSQALTKLSTGSLEVWAAAWGSTIDPDMYQVYHKNSTATSVYAWGYREIKADPSTYSYESGIINSLSDLIDDGRETMDQATRKGIYEQAMGYVLDLAVEMPLYQRKNLYAYNSKTLGGLTVVYEEGNEDAGINPYTSPLERVWELELLS